MDGMKETKAPKKITVTAARKAIKMAGGNPEDFDYNDRALAIFESDWHKRQKLERMVRKAVKWLKENGYEDRASCHTLGCYVNLDWSRFFQSTT